MQIIIPMSGFGERFRQAGYSIPKPLIEIDGKPIISYVIDMFPGEKDFLFICNLEHLNNPSYRMRELLFKACPSGRVVGINPHKFGPIYAVRQVANLIDFRKPTIVNYCDFTCYWDWGHFKKFVELTECAGAIPAYKGFHPHTLGSTNYAYMLEANGWVEDIQEKKPYTDNRMEEFASSGTYYFSSGELMCHAFRNTMDSGLAVNGEYYVSLAYKSLIKEDLPVAVYPLQHFMQWGTPQDVAEYRNWSTVFSRLVDERNVVSEPHGSLIMPMAGMGQRFAKEGYALSKPLIPVSGKPMVIQAVNDLPSQKQYAFVLRQDMPGYMEIVKTIDSSYPNATIKDVVCVTEGQACTAQIGIDALRQRNGKLIAEPVTFGACDNGCLYDVDVLEGLIKDDSIDVIVWGVRYHANAVRHPEMFGWIDADVNGRIKQISVKKPLDSPSTDAIVIGTFTFKRADDFCSTYERLVAREGRVNGEFYLDSCINDAIELGLRCYLFEVDSFISWGTPNDLKTFEYWQSCFHKWEGHRYRLEDDRRLNLEALQDIEYRYRKILPEIISKKSD